MIALSYDARAALAAREAAPLTPSHACLGCLVRGARPAERAEVSEPDALCEDCAPRYLDAGAHLMSCRCDECRWFDDVASRQALCDECVWAGAVDGVPL